MQVAQVQCCSLVESIDPAMACASDTHRAEENFCVLGVVVQSHALAHGLQVLTMAELL